jgi:nucleolar GTP-binding protein
VYPEIPTILRSDELLDKALSKAAKITKEDKDSMYRVRKTVSAQLESVKDTLVESLAKYVSTFPNLDKVETYERELIDVVVGVEPLRKALGRVAGGKEVAERILMDNIKSVSRSRDVGQMKKSKTAAIGRASSVIEELGSALLFLGRARDILRAVPEVTPGDPTIVIAGYPNVGKSSLLARFSKARPEIAPYPFTTKSANIGHFHWPEKSARHHQKRYQLVDTPGLLEKPPEKRNHIEQQAALALRYLADVIVFMLDPSESCGYDNKAQLALLANVRDEFPGAPILVVENKLDMIRTKSLHLKISCETGDGIPELKKAIVAAIPEDKYQDLFADELPAGDAPLS